MVGHGGQILCGESGRAFEAGSSGDTGDKLGAFTARDLRGVLRATAILVPAFSVLQRAVSDIATA
jgi:hypothetical protein